MPLYQYIAKDNSGNQIKGEFASESAQAAVTSLRAQNIYVFSVSEKKEIANTSVMKKELFKKSIKKKDVAVFSRQFAIMLQAGVPLPTIFEVMIKQEKNPSFKEILENLNLDVLKGKTLSSSMANYKIFPQLMTSMVEVGEANGRLEVAFERISGNMEKEIKLFAKVKSAMVYPIVLLVVSLIVASIMILFVLPKFSAMFTQMGAKLPAVTLVFLGISSFVINYWYVILIVIFVLMISIYKIFHEPVTRLQIDKFVYSLPIFGNMQKIILMANFCRTFSSLVDAGVGVISSLEIARNVNKNLFAKKCIDEVITDVQAGATISQSISNFKIFTPLVVSMCKIGEESGRIGDTLSRTADIYEDETDTQLQRMSALMEPAVTVLMALGIGFIVISVVQPMFQLYTVIGK